MSRSEWSSNSEQVAEKRQWKQVEDQKEKVIISNHLHTSYVSGRKS